MGEQLDGQRGVHSASSQDGHHGVEDGDDPSRALLVCPGIGRDEVGNDEVQLGLEEFDQLEECFLHDQSEDLLGLQGVRVDVFVRPEEVKELAGVTQPEGQTGRVETAGRSLGDFSHQAGDSGQHLSQSHGSHLGDDVRSVEGGGPEPGGHVEDVGGGQLEVDQGGVQVGDDGGEEVVLRLVTELQNCREDFLRSLLGRLPLLTAGAGAFPGAVVGVWFTDGGDTAVVRPWARSSQELSFSQVERGVRDVAHIVEREIAGTQGLLGESRLVNQAEVRGQTVGEAVLHQDVVDHGLRRVVGSDLDDQQRNIPVGEITLDLDDDGPQLLVVEGEGGLRDEPVLLSSSLQHRLRVGQTPLEPRRTVGSSHLVFIRLLGTLSQPVLFLLFGEDFLHPHREGSSETLVWLRLHLAGSANSFVRQTS